MGPLLVSLFQSRIDPDLTAERLLEQILADWGPALAEEFESVTAESR